MSGSKWLTSSTHVEKDALQMSSESSILANGHSCESVPPPRRNTAVAAWCHRDAFVLHGQHNLLKLIDKAVLAKIEHVPDDIFVFEEHVLVFSPEVFSQTLDVTFIQQVQNQNAGHPEGNVGHFIQPRHFGCNQVFGHTGARLSHACLGRGEAQVSLCFNTFPCLII